MNHDCFFQQIMSMIRAMNPNKSHGFDNISIRMIKLCGDTLML